MTTWEILHDLPGDGFSATEAVFMRLEGQDLNAFVAFVREQLARVCTPLVRAAYEVMDGRWSNDWDFSCFAAWALLQGREPFERLVADPACLPQLGWPWAAGEFVTALGGLDVQVDTTVVADPGASFPQIERWREERYRSVVLEHPLAAELAQLIASSRRTVLQGWGTFELRRGAGVAKVHFESGAAFDGSVPDDAWTPLLGRVVALAEPDREVVVEDLGVFRFVLRPAREARHPVTGERFVIPAVLTPVFSPASSLRQVLLSG